MNSPIGSEPAMSWASRQMSYCNWSAFDRRADNSFLKLLLPDPRPKGSGSKPQQIPSIRFTLNHRGVVDFCAFRAHQVLHWLLLPARDRPPSSGRLRLLDVRAVASSQSIVSRIRSPHLQRLGSLLNPPFLSSSSSSDLFFWPAAKLIACFLRSSVFSLLQTL